MHDTAYKHCSLFFENYLQHIPFDLNVIEVGSQDVNGSLKDIFNRPNIKYTGLDFVSGKNVDMLLIDPYKLPLADNSVDVLVTSSCLEHCDMFWVLYLDMLRVLKPHGLLYINVPSNRGVFHRYPVDCWRFMPDAGKALEKWGSISGYTDCTMLESFVGNMGADEWQDFVTVILKDKQYTSFYRDRITASINEFENGLKGESSELINFKY